MFENNLNESYHNKFGKTKKKLSRHHNNYWNTINQTKFIMKIIKYILRNIYMNLIN